MPKTYFALSIRVFTVVLLVVCAFIASPTEALGRCCDIEVMCGCDGNQQCCDHEELNAMACSAQDKDYCRDVCDVIGG